MIILHYLWIRWLAEGCQHRPTLAYAKFRIKTLQAFAGLGVNKNTLQALYCPAESRRALKVPWIAHGRLSEDRGDQVPE